MKQLMFQRLVLGWCCIGFFSCMLVANATPISPPAVPQITQVIDASQRIPLPGNTNALVVNGKNLGAVADDYSMPHMQLLLQRSPPREQALEQFIDQLHDRTSPNFHQWLTASQFGALYGPAQQDIQTVPDWLQSNGFTVSTVYPSGMLVDFSGTAGQVEQAFDTQMAKFDVN